MAKEILAKIKLHVPAAKANPAPPVGPALGQHGVNIMEFCKAFNSQTEGREGLIIPVEISVYSDRSFTFILKSPPASVLLKRVAGVAKGSPEPNKIKVATVNWDQIREIVKTKQSDLTAADETAAMRTIAGTARSMGIIVE